jgi:hypothetical protein
LTHLVHHGHDAILEPLENVVDRLVIAPFGAKLVAKRSVMRRKAAN